MSSRVNPGCALGPATLAAGMCLALSAFACSEGTTTMAEDAGVQPSGGSAGAGGEQGWAPGVVAGTSGILPTYAAVPALPLQVDGRHLRDSAGHTVVLRGVNQHGFLDVPDGAWDAPGEELYAGMGQWRPEVVQATLDDYRAFGFNVVRFHTIVEWWKNDPQTYSDPYRDVTYPKPYRELMADVVGWAAERGLYVIFDFFALRNVDGVQSGQESLPWPPWGRDAEVVADRAEFIAVWETVAEELGAQPNVLFELYNEPHGDAAAEAEWFEFVAEVLPVLRAHTNNPVIVQWDYMCWVNLDYPPPQYDASTLQWMEQHPLDDPNVAYGTHLYRNSGAGGPGMPHRSQGGLENLWERSDIEQGLSYAELPRAVGEWNHPLVVTELGAYLSNGGEDREQEVAWLSNTLDVLNSWSIGYVGWAWRSDEQLDHGMLHQGEPNDAGETFLAALPDE